MVQSWTYAHLTTGSVMNGILLNRVQVVTQMRQVDFKTFGYVNMLDLSVLSKVCETIKHRLAEDEL